MSVLLNTAMVHGRKVVVDDVSNGLDVNATSHDTGSNQNRAITGTESTHGPLTLLLSAISMDGGARNALIEQEIVELISGTLAVDEDNGAAGLLVKHEVNESLALELGLDEVDLLDDVLVSAAGAADTETDMFLREVGLGDVAKALGEGGGEEHILDVALFLFCEQS